MLSFTNVFHFIDVWINYESLTCWFEKLLKNVQAKKIDKQKLYHTKYNSAKNGLGLSKKKKKNRPSKLKYTKHSSYYFFRGYIH